MSIGRSSFASAAVLVVSLVSVLTFASGCGSYQPPTTPFPHAAPRAEDWASVLHRPARVTLDTWETGRVRVTRKDVLDMSDPLARSTFADGELYVPVFAHVSGAMWLPRDMPFVVGRGEHPTSYGFLFFEDALHAVPALEEIDFTNVPAMPPLGPSLDVLGDGSVWAITTPGHTVGHLAFVVVTKRGPVDRRR